MRSRGPRDQANDVKQCLQTRQTRNKDTGVVDYPPWKRLKLKRETSNNAGKKIIRLNDFYYREETNLKHTMRLHPGKTVC